MIEPYNSCVISLLSEMSMFLNSLCWTMVGGNIETLKSFLFLLTCSGGAGRVCDVAA